MAAVTKQLAVLAEAFDVRRHREHLHHGQWSSEAFRCMFEAGADVFRVSMSHTRTTGCARWWRRSLGSNAGRTGSNRCGTFAALGRLLLVAALMGATLGPAAAHLRVCNKTGSQLSIALGFKDVTEGWTTQGWWPLSAHSCDTLIEGALPRRYYFIYAVDDDDGSEWSGEAFMCTRDTKFTVRGFNDCVARGYNKTGFLEVDTQRDPSVTVNLGEPSRRR